jgi:hypothetical protein
MKQIKTFDGYDIYDEEINRFLMIHNVKNVQFKFIERNSGKITVVLIYDDPVTNNENINLNGLNK